MSKYFCVAIIFLVSPVLSFAAPSGEVDRSAVISSIENGLVERSERGNPNAPRHTLRDRLQHHGVGGIGVAIIQNGEVFWSGGFGLRQVGSDMPVDADTVFSAGSVSKMLNATLVLRLVANGTLDLDAPVNGYMKRWQVPTSSYGTDGVTLRRILSHTAGFNIHGFGDFQPGQRLPDLLDTLNGRSPAQHERVHLIHAPGTVMDYSGGGTQVSQLVIEDVTGMAYEDAMRRYVFEPLGMTRSTFQNPLDPEHGNIAYAHDRSGKPTALPRGFESMPEIAASGLWVSANDLAKLVIALLGRGPNADLLPANLRADMISREPNSWHGLGPRVNGEGESLVFHHGGANNSYRAWMEGHPATGDGVVLLTNGTHGSRLYSEVRKAIEQTMDWKITAETGFERPDVPEGP